MISQSLLKELDKAKDHNLIEYKILNSTNEIIIKFKTTPWPKIKEIQNYIETHYRYQTQAYTFDEISIIKIDTTDLCPTNVWT